MKRSKIAAAVFLTAVLVGTACAVQMHKGSDVIIERHSATLPSDRPNPFPSTTDISFDIDEARSATRSVNAFAFDLYRELAKDENGNVFFSPQNVSSAFAMLYAGASDDTEREIRRVFHYNDGIHADMRSLQNILNGTAPDVAVVEAANAVWPAKDLTLSKTYTDLLQSYYNSEVVPLNYRNDAGGAVDAINRWASKKTHGRIPQIVDALDPETRLVLTSAIYFKSEWAVEFPKKQTREQPFHKADGSETKVDLMNRRGHVLYYETDRFQAVRLPYKNNAFSMLALLPRERGAIQDLEAAVSIETFGEIIAGMLHPFDVILFVPKFSFRTGYELADPLKHMGLKRSFTDGAQFSRLADDPLKINRVVHKTFIEVDEKTTEAAAATAITMMETRSAPKAIPEPKIFRADHPFLFFILENKTNAILFMGRYMGP